MSEAKSERVKEALDIWGREWDTNRTRDMHLADGLYAAQLTTAECQEWNVAALASPEWEELQLAKSLLYSDCYSGRPAMEIELSTNRLTAAQRAMQALAVKFCERVVAARTEEESRR